MTTATLCTNCGLVLSVNGRWFFAAVFDSRLPIMKHEVTIPGGILCSQYARCTKCYTLAMRAHEGPFLVSRFQIHTITAQAEANVPIE